MKTILALFITCLILNPIKAQLISSGNMDDLRKDTKKIIFVTYGSKKTEDKAETENLKNLLKKYWTLSDNYEVMPSNIARKEHRKRILAERKTSFLAEFGSSRDGARPDNHDAGVLEYRIVVSPGNVFGASPNYALAVYPPIGFGQETKTIVCLMLSQFMVRDPEFRSDWFLSPSAKKHGHRLKEKTLLIDEKSLQNLSAEDVKNTYPFKHKIVLQDEITTAIINQDPNVLVLYQTKIVSVGGRALPLRIIYDPEDGALVSFSTWKLGAGLTLFKADFRDFIKNSKL